MRIRRLSLAIALGSAAALPGCFDSDWSGPGLGPDRRVAEVHGRYISSATAYTPITWSPSGEEVTFVSGDYRIAYAHHLESGAIRQLYGSTSNRERIYGAALSADGVDWFTSSLLVRQPGDPPGTEVVIRRHTSAGSIVLTDRGEVFSWDAARGSGVLVAPSQPVAAFIVLPDSLFLLRRGGEPTLLGSGCLGILAFSPDQSRVLCRRWPPSFRVFRTDGGAAESLVLPPAVEAMPQSIRWDAQGIQVLYRDGARYLLYEQGSGSSRPVSGVGPGRVSWSSDGTKVAYWCGYCAQEDYSTMEVGFFELIPGCRIRQGFLYVLDVATGTATRVAVHTLSNESTYQVALSPTGSIVGYTINGGFYLLEVR